MNDTNIETALQKWKVEDDTEKCELSFRIWYRYGNASTIKGSTHVLVSDQFNGINGSNVDQDKQTVENCEWTEVFAQEELPTKPNSTSETAESAKLLHSNYLLILLKK